MTINSTKQRFIIVGILNTVTDFGLLFLLSSAGMAPSVANIFSTTAAFLTSFFANKAYTFQTKGSDLKREMFRFIIVTLCGIWIVQTSVILLTQPILSTIISPDSLALLAAKVCAVTAGLFWNYTMYSRFVFTNTASTNSSEQ